METLIIDESGTPLADDLLVVGGVAISGSTEPVEIAFARLAAEHTFPRKGTKYSRAQFQALADFLTERQVIPIASFSRLAAEDIDALRVKGRQLEAILSDGVKRNVSGYLWMQQVAQTIIPALCASVAANRGPIAFVRLEFDQFTLPDWVRDAGERVVSRWLDVPNRVEPFIKSVEERMNGHDDYFTGLRRNLVFGPTDHELVWKAPERRGRLADAVAALFRKAKLGHPEAAHMWDALEEGHRRADGDLPTCVGLDLTERIRESCHRDWPMTQVG